MSSLYDLGRFEFKYAMPVANRDRILELAGDSVKPDPHALPLPNGAMGYEVHSLYLDTPRLDDYFERLQECRVRDRLRVRTYGRPGQKQPVFLENKRKLENWVIKHRVKVTTSDDWNASDHPRPWELFIGSVRGARRYAARHFQELTSDAGRVPVSVVHYEREVWVARDPDQPKVRLTLDRKVSATVNPLPSDLYAEPDVYLLPEDWMVVELKFDHNRPGWMRAICRELGLRAHPVSKFGLSVAKGVAGTQYGEVRYLTPVPLRQPRYLPPRPERRPGGRRRRPVRPVWTPGVRHLVGGREPFGSWEWGA